MLDHVFQVAGEVDAIRCHLHRLAVAVAPGVDAHGADALDGLSAYDPEQTYIEGDLVVVGKRIYQATGPVPVNTAPPNVGYWIDVGQVLVTANGLAQQLEINTTSITELDGVVTALASSLQALRSAYRDDSGEGDLADALQGYNASASFAQEVKTRASQNEAMVQRQTELTASVGEVAGTVTDLESVVVTDRQATAQAIQQIGVELGETSAAVETVSQAQVDTDGKLSTMWSVKMQLNQNGQYVYAGVGLGIENVEGVLQSQFLVSADRFRRAWRAGRGAGLSWSSAFLWWSEQISSQ